MSNAKDWQHLRPNASQRIDVSWSQVRTYVVEREFQRTSRKMRYCRMPLVDILPTRYFQRQSHYRLDRSGKEDAITTSRVHSTTRRLSSRPHWQAIYRAFTIAFASGLRLNNQVHTPRRAEDEEQIDLEPEQLTLITKKTAKRATSSRRLDATTHRESRDADSQGFRTGSICQNGGNWTTQLPVNLFWMETVLHFFCREHSEPWNSQNSRLQVILDSHVQIGPMTGIAASILSIYIFWPQLLHDFFFKKIIFLSRLGVCPLEASFSFLFFFDFLIFS